MSAFLVKVVQGQRKCTVRCDDKMTVFDLQKHIEKTEYVPLRGQKLLFKGRAIKAEMLLSALGLKASSKLRLMFSKEYHQVSARLLE